MSLIPKDGALHEEMRLWRRDLHAHPETAYEEFRTADKVAALLSEWGLSVHRGLAGTGVVATLYGNRQGANSIGLRADMDALPLQELNDFAHRSTHPGKMHGCGHDGHTAMLLGAAKYLSQTRDFSGRVVFIFQPAEEGEAGAQRMCEQGLFEQFPVDAVYGMHNWPGLAEGAFAVHEGPVMASMDLFDITIKGHGCHGGMPHKGVDPVAVAGHLITALQTIVSRRMDPLNAAVVSVTQMHGGNAYNVVPDQVTLSGTCRAFSPEVRDQIEAGMRRKVEHLCAAFDATGELLFNRVYPSTCNTPSHAEVCHRVCEQLVGTDNVERNLPPSMGAEDFAFMLQERPGAYIWIGNGTDENSHSLHNPHYDFNDRILPLGASYWVSLVQMECV